MRRRPHVQISMHYLQSSKLAPPYAYHEFYHQEQLGHLPDSDGHTPVHLSRSTVQNDSTPHSGSDRTLCRQDVQVDATASDSQELGSWNHEDCDGGARRRIRDGAVSLWRADWALADGV
jgi:hypothetical protein